MALQQKIESKLEKSLGNQINIQWQQQMGAFQASMFEAMKSLRDEFQSMKKSVKTVEVDQIPTPVSKPGTSQQTDTLPPNTLMRPWSWTRMVHFFLLGLEMLCPNTTPLWIINQTSLNNPNRCAWLGLKNMRTSINTRLGPSIFLSLHLQRRISPLFP